MRLIDADALLKLVDSDAPAISEHMIVTKAWVMAVLQSRKLAPTIDAVPVLHGTWVTDNNTAIGELIERYCSLCHCRTTGLRETWFPYCPCCGANMEHTKAVTFQTEGGEKVEFTKVVRCKDCKWSKPATNGKGQDGYGCTKDDNPAYEAFWWLTPDWFCADGERRESE